MATFDTKTMYNFEKYLELQKSGKLNMVSPQVRDALNISKEEHHFILENYNALLEEFKSLKFVDEVLEDAKARADGDKTQEKTMGFNDIGHEDVQK